MKSLQPALLVLSVLTASCTAVALPRPQTFSPEVTALLDEIDRAQQQNPPAHEKVRRGQCASSAASVGGACEPSDTKKGLFPDTATCTTKQVAAIRDAINGVRYLGFAGQSAVSSTFVKKDGNPAPYFFGTKIPATVGKIYSAAISYTMPKTDRAPIRVSCVDEAHLCTDSKAAYVPPGRPDTIVVCPIFGALPSHAESMPCKDELTRDGINGMGAMNRAEVLMDAFVRAVTNEEIGRSADGTRDCHTLLQENDPSRSVLKNAGSYAWMANWAYYVGLGRMGGDCLQRFVPIAFQAGTGEYPSNAAWLRDVFQGNLPQELRGRPAAPPALGSVPEHDGGPPAGPPQLGAQSIGPNGFRAPRPGPPQLGATSMGPNGPPTPPPDSPVAPPQPSASSASSSGFESIPEAQPGAPLFDSFPLDDTSSEPSSPDSSFSSAQGSAPSGPPQLGTTSMGPNPQSQTGASPPSSGF